ncbi:MAG: ABC transporter ATP-binding protein [Erysipelotrichaceae bacterium]
MTTLKINNLSIIYPSNHIALDHLSFTIDKKTFFVICGPSGCGKTTLLHSIAGLIKSEQGSILIDDQPLKNAPDVAMVFQDPALFNHLSVFDNIALGLSLGGFKQNHINELVNTTADMLSIKELLKRKAGTLSGGQQQRVAIARALVRKPKIFLMDEPLSSLDVNLKRQLRMDLVKIYQQSNATFIYVTHDQGEAMSLGEQILLMKDGRIEQLDTPRNIYDQPTTLFSARFFKEGMINVFDGFIKDKALYIGDGKYSCTLQDYDLVQVVIPPDAIYIGSSTQFPSYNGTIEYIEWVKDIAYYHVVVKQQSFLMKSKELHQLRENVTFYINSQYFQYFDKLGKRL